MIATPPSLRWGILGCARITRRGLVPGIAKSSGSRLVALGSRDLATAESWAREFGVDRAYGSYEEVIADPNVQAVYVPLPNEIHREWVERAATAGKHVLCEKPLALDAVEAEAMVEHCRRAGVILIEAFMWPHQPRAAVLRKLVNDGAIGDLRLIRSSFSFPIDMTDWRLDASRGGGALWDVGCYGVSTARYFAESEPTAIRARAHFGETGVDLSVAATLEFPGHVLAQIDCSFEQPFRCTYELVGTRGVIEVPDAYLPPAQPVAYLRKPDAAPETLTFDGRNQYAAMVDAFAASVAAGQLVDPCEDGLMQMRALDAILAACRD
jgi:D-xylose 1-dehydrogenase (NADP+, D-xylono-1,5-lactone-forming)